METSVESAICDTGKLDDPFYTEAAKFWSNIPCTVDGMLGGFGFISHTDIQGSQTFLKQIFKLDPPPGNDRALDCGAGIGRITKNLLLHNFNKVDLVEQNSTFVEEARTFIGPNKKVGDFFCSGLQNFVPKAASYDIIWCQWVLGHLTDMDLVHFYKSCIIGLKPNGMIVLKENIASGTTVEVDKLDSSVTRPLPLFVNLIKLAGLKCIKEWKQNHFPQGLYQVRMFALRPNNVFNKNNECNNDINSIS